MSELILRLWGGGDCEVRRVLCSWRSVSRGDSGSVSSGSTFLQRSQAMEGGWLLVFSPSPLSILFSPSPPSPPLVDKEERFWWHCENPRVAGFHPSSRWVKHTPPLQREVWSQNRRPGVDWRAYSRSQCRCAHVGNLAMPGESLPLWGSPPRLWPGHHVQLPHRPRAGSREAGAAPGQPSLPSLEVAGTPHNSRGLAAFPGELSPRESLARLFPGRDCLRSAPVAPFSGCWAGGPVLALALRCSLLSKNWFCNAHPSTCAPTLTLTCLIKEVVTQGRQVPGRAAWVVA